MEIIWSRTANNTYLDIIEQTFERWNIETVELFETQTNQLIRKIQRYNHICPKSKIEDVHKCTINKLTSLVYRIKDKNTIEITKPTPFNRVGFVV